MTKPVYKIETYTAAVLDHTITKDVITLHVKNRVTSAPGLFSFSVPTKKNGDTYYYNDVALDDKVKIWLGYDSVSGDPDFVGKILNISAPLSVPSGYIRVFTGKDQGEILERRQKTKYWQAIGAATIVEELCDDLGLDKTEVTADATAVTLTAINEPYWHLLQRLSDYWASGGTQIKKDFFVSWDDKLHWKVRPIRTTNLETLTVGYNIASYNVMRDAKAIKNKIRVYGAMTKTYPTDIDGLTDAVTDWAAGGGDSVATDTDRKCGDYSVKISDAGTGANATRSNIGTISALYPDRETYKYLNFHFKIADDAGAPVPYMECALNAPDATDIFKWIIYWNTTPRAGPLDTWLSASLPLGDPYVVAGKWIKFVNAAWDNIQAIRFTVYDAGASNISVKIDCLHFSHARYYDLADAGAAVVREYAVVDDNLLTDSDCQKRAETLLYQMQNTPIRIDVVTPGNMNLLVGDRLSMTIPAADISAVNYDVAEVDHNLSKVGFVSTVKMVNTADKRALPPITHNEVLLEQFKIQKQIASGLRLTQ